MTATTFPVSAAVPRKPLQLGRAFVHPAFDLMVIGGGLSLCALAWMKLTGSRVPSLEAVALLAFLVNSPHFAASTVRLYTKPNAFRDLPFVTKVLPLAMLVVLGVGLALPDSFGTQLVALYFTWSPYHYAAQTYGLALMYSYRSGIQLSDGDKKLIRVACLLPFLFAFLDTRGVLLGGPTVAHALAFLLSVLRPACLVVPMLLFLAGALGRGPRLPVISILTIVANAFWWTTLRYMDAFVWATIFHGLQYLAIVIIFHVRERREREPAAAPAVMGRWLRPAAEFYAVCVVVGYVLFQAWPHASVLAHLRFSQSLLIMVAIINIHHFIVDAYIWRLRRDPNYAVVTSETGRPRVLAAVPAAG
ncbi:MAG TPA: hypothetical protein VFT38_06415 [Vicinamibacteria bacterium]|nr:hypothetical protein [Vicinamibacteria bacterium]